jgi:iron(III) transport system substrate-binding protein
MPRAWLITICVAAAILVGLLAWVGRVKEPDKGRIVVDVFESDDTGSQPQLSREEMVEIATQQERELWWYTSAPEEQAIQFLGAFEAMYPGIRARVNPGASRSTFQVIAQVEQELKAELRADVLHILDVGIFVRLRSTGDLLRYQSPEYASLPSAYRDEKGGYWGCMRAVAICLAYNARLVARDEAPKTWRDLWEPRWANGQIALENASAGSQYAREILQALERGDVRIAGEMMGYALYEWEREGHTDIVGVWPEDGVPLALAPVGILRRTKHPNAAKLFVDFALSRKGQELWQELLGAHSVREDVGPPAGRPPLSELTLLTTDDWQDYVEKQSRLRDEFSATFQKSFD